MEVETILVNRYEICQQLSKKAARQTFLAKDLHTQQLVIIKTLQFGPEFQWDDLKLFEREAKTLQNLNHPGIPKYLDYFESEIDNIKSFFLIQTYIDAPSLETVIRNGRKFSEVEVIELAESFLNILTYLHRVSASQTLLTRGFIRFKFLVINSGCQNQDYQDLRM